MDNLEQIHDEFSEKFVTPFVEALTKEFAENPPLGLAISPEAWQQKNQQKIKDTIELKELRNRIDRGFQLIQKELSSHLTPLEMEEVSEEWLQGMREIVKLSEENRGKKPLTEDQLEPLPLQELMHLSDKAIEQVYQCGIRLYQHGHLQDASDVFFVTNLLDFRRHNVWMALGITEQKLNHIEPALTAFSMASITNPDSPLPYIHSSECYIAVGDTTDAIECLDAATHAIELHPTSQDSRKLRECVTTLRRQCAA